MRQRNTSAQLICFMLLVICGSIFSATAARAGEIPLPTLDQIKELYANKDYRQAMSACQRIMNLRDDSLAGFDRHIARMFCAECQLRLKLIKGAGETLDVAAKLAADKGNVADASEARALALLIRSSPDQIYQPKTGTSRERLSILEPASRQSAFLALFADRFEWCKKQQQDAREYESLTPMLELAKTFEGVRAVELVSTKSSAQSEALGMQLSRWSGNMVGKVLGSYEKVVMQVERDTNVGPNRKLHRGRQVPLNAMQISELQRIAADSQRVPAAIDQLNVAFAHPLMESADNNRARAQDLVDRISAIMAENERAPSSGTGRPIRRR